MPHAELPPHVPDPRDGARRGDARHGDARHGEVRHADTHRAAEVRHLGNGHRRGDAQHPVAHHAVAHHVEGEPVALAALGHGALARVESVGGGSLGPLLERLGIRAGTVVRCQTCASSTIVLLVGSRLVPIPRAWAHAVIVTPFEPAPLGDQHPRSATTRPVSPPTGAGPSLMSREEASFVTDASSRILG
jgi:hypothetical protein